jgi:hypothetical protein
MREILEEYHHILEHDNFDCSSHISGESFIFKCWFKRYGFPLVCLGGFLAYAYFVVKREINKKHKLMMD